MTRPEQGTDLPLDEDRADLHKAQNQKAEKENPEPERFSFWRSLGPGLITGAADDDPSGIGTYSVAGAQYGLGLLWMAPLSLPLMIAVQEMCGRIGVVCGKGLAAVIKEYYSKWILYGAVLMLLVANVINIYADLNVMAASAKMLFHGPFVLWLIGITVFTVLTQIFVPYRQYVKFLKWMSLALVSYVVVALLPGTHNDWPNILRRTFVPYWSWKTDFAMTVVGFLGTTISPYLFFWQASEEVEEEIADGKEDAPGCRKSNVSQVEMKRLRVDTAVGMFASQIVCFFIILCAASTLHRMGKTDINTAQDAASALRPLGAAAYWLFTLGILGTGLLAIPTMAGSVGYAVAEVFGWRYGLYRRWHRARKFYVTLAATTLLGFALNFAHSISPVKALFYSAVINGVVAVPLLIVLMRVCNDRRVVGDRVNGKWSNGLGWITVVFMGGAAAFMIWGMLTGHTS